MLIDGEYKFNSPRYGLIPLCTLKITMLQSSLNKVTVNMCFVCINLLNIKQLRYCFKKKKNH